MNVIIIFKNYMSKSLLIHQIKDIRLFSINTALKLNQENGYFIEFGVYDGESINFFAEKIGDKKIYGFDSFQGLKDDWIGHHLPAKTFDLSGKIPNLKKYYSYQRLGSRYATNFFKRE